MKIFQIQELRKKNIFLLLCVSFFISLIWTGVMLFFISLFKLSLKGGPAELTNIKNIYEFVFVMVVLAPLVETAVSQTLLFKLLRYKRKISIKLAIIISSLIFGLLHSYSVPYVVFGVGAGFILNYFYIVVRLQRRSGFIWAFFLHGLWNLCGVVVTRFL